MHVSTRSAPMLIITIPQIQQNHSSFQSVKFKRWKPRSRRFEKSAANHRRRLSESKDSPRRLMMDMKKECVYLHRYWKDATSLSLLLTRREKRYGLPLVLVYYYLNFLPQASTQFFSDTGVMALLCRHDRVLWLINMTSAGEKQHYALALIRRWFQHLPSDFKVGLLYDIGCQLERSCRKWGFLADVLPRIIFGISIFHAFGHQWPCQIVYHPRKCVGFGLSDGEGCERFWSAIKPLIPSLRVSGVRCTFTFFDCYLTLSQV
jgi:hypothetical protein